MADRVSQLKTSTQQQQLGVEEQLSLVKFLRHAVQYKDEQISLLQAELVGFSRAADAQLESVQSELQSELEDAQHELLLSELERQRLEGELHAFRALEPEVESLRHQADELQTVLGKERRDHDAQLRRLGDDYQEYRGALQEEFSMMVESNGLVDLSASKVAESDNESEHEQSRGEVALKASLAQSAGRIEELGNELLAAQRAGDAAMSRHAILSQELNSLRVDHSVQEQSLRLETKNAVKYKKKLKAAEAKLERYEAQAEKAEKSREHHGPSPSPSESVLDESSLSSAGGGSRLQGRRASAGSARSSGSMGSERPGKSRSRVGSAGSVGSRGRPASRAGSELGDYLEKRRMKAQLDDDEILAQTALAAGVDMSAWAQAAVHGGSPPGAAPALTGVWSSSPDPVDRDQSLEFDYRDAELGTGSPELRSPGVEGVRSGSSFRSVESPAADGQGARRSRAGGVHRTFRHGMLAESSSKDRPGTSGRVVPPIARFLAP